MIRVGTVMKVDKAAGKVQVQETENTTVMLPLVTFGNEYNMPKVGDDVIVLHFAEGSSKGVCLGTYYGGDNVPKANNGYRKDFDNESFIACKNGKFEINASEIKIMCDYTTITVEQLIKRIERLESIIDSLS